MKQIATIAISTAITAIGLLYWLHDGDLYEAVEPVVEQWTQPEETPKETRDITPTL